MARESNDRAKASEMEHALRAHIREHMDQDPVAYRKLSERLDALLAELGEQWAALAQLFELLMQAHLLPAPEIEALVDKLMELARANHDRLMKA